MDQTPNPKHMNKTVGDSMALGSHIEHRHRHGRLLILWVLLATTLALIVSYFPMLTRTESDLWPWRGSERILVIGLCGLIVLFCIYMTIQERRLLKFRKELARGREEVLLESRRRFDYVTENIDVFWIMNMETRTMEYVSPSYEKIWNRSPNNLHQSLDEWLSAIHEDDRKRVDETLEHRARKQQYIEEFRIVRPDGSIRWIRERGSAIPGVNGSGTKFVSVATDITEYKNLETQMSQAQRMDAVGRLAGIVTNDCISMMSLLQSKTETLLSHTNNAKYRQSLEMIRRIAEKAISRAHDLAASYDGQLWSPGFCNLNELIGNMEALFKDLIDTRIEISFQLDPKLGLAKAKPSHVQQVLLPLVVHASDKVCGSEKVVIQTANVHVSGGYAKNYLSLSPGTYVMLAIFVGSNDCVQSLALNLSELNKISVVDANLRSVYERVRSCGGQLCLYNQHGGGTAYEMYLPCVVHDSIIHGEAESEISRDLGTVLLVEDQEDLRPVFREVLEERGFRVWDAANGPEALLLCCDRKEPVDVLVTDMILPGMNGFELATRLKTLYQPIKVLYVSAYSADMLSQNELLEGEEFLRKPLDADSLGDAVCRLLEISENAGRY